MARLRLHIHVSEPWNFERENITSELIGWTVDHEDPECEDWLVHLDERFIWDESGFSAVMVTPRYFGERLARVVGTLATVSVDMGRRIGGLWTYDMVGILALQHGEN